MKIAILGAECTGKTQLARALTQALVSRIDDTASKDFLIADTPALMAAIYHDVLFNDASWYPAALEQHHGYDLTLVMGLDLPPWAPNGVQRDGPHSQSKVDARLREVLQTKQLDYAVVYGIGVDRTDCALQTILHRTQKTHARATKPSAWRWSCEKCSDSDCEHRLFSELMASDSMRV
jgi:nicotinamide riboside kinase